MMIRLQYNASEQNQLSKAVQDVIAVDGTLRDQTAVTDPSIIFEFSGALPQVNYMTIPDFNRSYFITGIESVRNGLWRISAHVDVLSSFAPQIRANRAIVRRNQNEWNMYLDDGQFKCYQDPTIVMKKFPAGFNTYEFVLAVAGG